MRVICSTINGKDVEGEVIGGRVFDVEKDSDDLDEMLTVRCNDDDSQPSRHVQDVSI